MVYVLFSLLLFCASVAVHIFYCRGRSKSMLHVKAFILIAVFFLAVYVTVVLTWLHAPSIDPSSWWGMPVQVTAGTLFFLLVPIYVCFYTLTQLMSPSKKILLTMARQGDLSYADIVLCVGEENFIGTRLSDLCASGCVVQNEDRFVISPSGQKMAAFLDIMQRVLGRDMGG